MRRRWLPSSQPLFRLPTAAELAKIRQLPVLVTWRVDFDHRANRWVEDTMQETEKTVGDAQDDGTSPPDAAVSGHPATLQTYEEWQRFVDTPTLSKPRVPSPGEWEKMSKSEREATARGRIRYHSGFGPLLVPKLEPLVTQTVRLALSNRHTLPVARQGVVIDGDGTLGKSTAALEIGRRYERAIRKGHRPDTHAGAHFIPVAYMTLPGEISIRSFNESLVAFYNLPRRRSDTSRDYTNDLIRQARDSCTSMLIIDDIHYLTLRRSSTQAAINLALKVNNHLKYLANCIAGTFVYVGIGVDETGLLVEGHAQEYANFSQTRYRFRKFPVTRFGKGSPEFLKTLLLFEKELCLVHQRQGDLAKHADYLHDRTAGAIGSISALLREAANESIIDGTERITRRALASIMLSTGAEAHFREVNPSAYKADGRFR